LKATAVADEKFAPVMTTLVPAGPLMGVKEVMVGGTVTTKSAVLVPVPAELVTLIFPVVAAAGTVAVI